MAGLINWKKVAIPGGNPDADHMYVGVDIADSRVYTKNSAGVVSKFETSTSVASAISTAISDHVALADPHTQYVKDDDDRLFTQNVLRVKLNPGDGEYASIADALLDVVAPSSTNRWAIVYGAGEFTEPETTLPSYVSVMGESIQTTTINVATNTENLFILNTGCEVSFMTLRGLSGANKAAIKVSNVGDFAQLHKLSIYDFDIGIENTASTADSILYVEYVDISGEYAYAVKTTASGGFSCSTNLENFYTFASNAVGSIACFVSGTTAKIQLFTSKMFCAATQKAIVGNNGASIKLNGVDINDSLVGCEIENVGAGCSISALATQMAGNVDDYIISNPTASGSILSGTTKDKVTIDNLASVALLLLDTTEKGIIVNGNILYSQDNFEDVTDISALITETPTMGVVKGGALSLSSGLTLSIADGFGYQSISSTPIDKIVRRDWAAQTILLPADSNVFIYLNGSNTFVSNVTKPETTENILLGRVVTNATDIIYIEKSPIHAEHITNQLDDSFRSAFGPVYASGSIPSESGARQLNITSGVYFYSSNKYQPAGGSPITFDLFYKSVTPGVFTRTTGQTTLSNTQYDDGSGTLQNLTALHYVKHLVLCLGGPSENYLVIYGQSEHATLAAARSSSLPDVPSFVTGAFARVCSVICQQGTANIVEFIDERPRIGFASSSTIGGGAADHGGLSGLNDDDHTQYLLTSGSRAMTGSLNMGSNNITSAGTVNGVTVEAHASRHLPNGSDALATGMPLSIGLSNATGTANAFSRQDHIHALPNVGTAGTYGSSSQVPAITTDAQGRVSSVTPTNIDHDALTNFAANEHVDHSAVSISSGFGLTGGGNITASRTLAVGLSVTSASATALTSTTSLTNVALDSMTLTPAAGTYLVFFDCSTDNSNNGKVNTFTLFVDGVLQADTVFGTIVENSGPHVVSFTAVETVNGSQAIEVRWRTSANTGRVTTRNLRVMRIA